MEHHIETSQHNEALMQQYMDASSKSFEWKGDKLWLQLLQVLLINLWRVNS